MRAIKFRVSKGTHTIGYETIHDGRWFASAEGTNWASGTYYGENLKRWQYTGLKDKNGVEIFEGDIVKLSSKDEPEVIEWHECFDWDDGSGYQFGKAHEESLEIIGNKYENSELLTA